MNIGTKSLCFGVHQVFIHPWFVARAWWKLYGFPWDPRLWVAFFVHDLGYWQKPNMDGPEGEAHTEVGGCIMGFLFGERWGDFCRYHSRFWAQKHGRKPSRLCVADKLAVALTPAWLYLPMAEASGELWEYIARAKEGSKGNGKYIKMDTYSPIPRVWLKNVQDYLVKWVEDHKGDVE